MTPFERLTAEADRLNRDEQLLLAEHLYAQLGMSEEIERAWANEIQRRSDALDRGEIGTIDGDEVLKAARKMVGR